MTTKNEHFSKGNWIVHASYGVGQIKGKGKKTLAGDKQTFLKVKTFNSVYWLPESNIDVDYIRPLSSRNKFGRALTLIRKPPNKLSKDHKQRKIEINQVFNSVSLYSKARMIRDLFGRKISSQLNPTEVAALEKMRKQLLNEWSVVNGEDRNVLKEKLDEALEISVEKSKVGEE